MTTPPNLYPEGHYAEITEAVLDRTPPEEVLSYLHLGSENPSVIKRSRIHFDGEHNIVSVSTSWYPAFVKDKCPDLLRKDAIKQGTAHYIAQQLDTIINESNSSFVHEEGTDRELEALNIWRPVSRANLPLPVTIKKSIHTFVTQQGQTVEFGTSIAPADPQNAPAPVDTTLASESDLTPTDTKAPATEDDA